MGTHAIIVVKRPRSFIASYCHYDGYVKRNGVGEMLLKHYNSAEDALKLVKMGSMSGLAPTFKDTPFHKTEDRLDYLEPVTGKSFDQVLDNLPMASYVYLWDGGKWNVARGYSSTLNDMFPLEDVYNGNEEF